MPVMSRSRLIASIAAFAMAFAALLPFTAAARMLLVDHPVEYCHQLAITAKGDHQPSHDDAPAEPRKRYCPFCASAVVAPPASPPPLPGFVSLDAGIVSVVFVATPPFGVELALPPSRAPPSPFPA